MNKLEVFVNPSTARPDLRDALTALLGEVGYLRSCIARGEKLTPKDLDRQDKAIARATSLLAALAGVPRVHIINGQPCDDPTCFRAHGLAGT